MSKLVAFWNSLSHPVQAVIIFFAGTVLSTLDKYVTAPNACMTFQCLGGYVGHSLTTGLIAVLALYSKSSFYQYQH